MEIPQRNYDCVCSTNMNSYKIRYWLHDETIAAVDEFLKYYYMVNNGGQFEIGNTFWCFDFCLFHGNLGFSLFLICNSWLRKNIFGDFVLLNKFFNESESPETHRLSFSDDL